MVAVWWNNEWNQSGVRVKIGWELKLAEGEFMARVDFRWEWIYGEGELTVSVEFRWGWNKYLFGWKKSLKEWEWNKGEILWWRGWKSDKGGNWVRVKIMVRVNLLLGLNSDEGESMVRWSEMSAWKDWYSKPFFVGDLKSFPDEAFPSCKLLIGSEKS